MRLDYPDLLGVGVALTIADGRIMVIHLPPLDALIHTRVRHAWWKIAKPGRSQMDTAISTMQIFAGLVIHLDFNYHRGSVKYVVALTTDLGYAENAMTRPAVRA